MPKDVAYPGIPFTAFPALRVLVVLILGGMLVHYLPLSESLVPPMLIFAALASIWIVVELPFLRQSNHYFYRSLLYLMLLFVTGASVWALYRLQMHQQKILIQNYAHLAWEEYLIEGIVVQVRDSNKGQYILEISQSEKQLIPKNAQILLRISLQERLSTRFFPKKGDRIRAVIRILPVNSLADAQKTQSSPFDELAYLQRLGVVAKADTPLIYFCESASVSWTAKGRDWVKAQLKESFFAHKDLHALSLAMVLADRSLLSTSQKEVFEKTGLSHVLAVSGLHVGMILLPLWWLMPFFWLNPRRKILFLGLCTLLMIYYIQLTGAPASVVRASAMAALLMVAKMWKKNGPAVNMLAFVALAMLSINPKSLLDVGFQLSFGAMISIFWVYRPLEAHISVEKRHSAWYKYVVGPLSFTLLLQVAMLPLSAQYFEVFSLIGPLANLIFLPFLGFFLFPFMLLNSLFGAWIPSWLVQVYGFMFDQMMVLIKQLSTWSYATIRVNAWTLLEYFLLIAIVIAINHWSYPRVRWLWVGLLLSGYLLNIWADLFQFLRL